MLAFTRSEQETAALAAALAPRLAKGDAVCLEGDLGTGKSVFARALIRTLCGDPALDVPSPTYTLVQVYDAPAAPLWHFDLYRMEAAEDVHALGWEDALADGIAIVEWPGRLGPLRPRNAFEVLLREDNGGRSIEIRPPQERIS